MANDSQFTMDAGSAAADYSDSGRSKSSGCLKGCLITAAVLFAIAIAVGVVVFFKWRDWAADFASNAADQVLQESQLPVQEQAEVKTQLDRAVKALRENHLSAQQFKSLVDNLLKSPLMTMAVATAVEGRYFAKLGLSEDEKTAGRTSMRRALRGAIDRKIPGASIDNIMRHIADKDPGGQWKLREQVSDDELRAFLDQSKIEADKAGVAEEPEDVDVSDEVKRIIDAALGGQ